METLSHMRHFYERTGGNGDQFVAVTDPGSGLVDLAARARLQAGVRERPEHRRAATRCCPTSAWCPRPWRASTCGRCWSPRRRPSRTATTSTPASSNSGLWMGLAMGELALQGRDKLTFIVSEPIASFGLWVEQLIAESTGKHGRGVLPVADEPVGAPEAYGDDRVFAYLRNDERARRRARRQGRGAAQGRPGGAHARPPAARPRTWAGSSSSPSSPPRWPAGCWRSTRSTSPTCRRPRTTPTRCSRPPSRRRWTTPTTTP